MGVQIPPRPLISSLLVFFSALIVFAPSVRYGFIQDDVYVLVNNPFLRSWRFLPRLLTTGYWEPWAGSSIPVSIFRPVVSLSYFLQIHSFGQAWAFHAANVLLHACVSALLYSLLRRWIPPGAALFAALLFAVHPVQNEAVVRVSSRPDLLCALFLFSAWGLLDRGRALGCAAFGLALGSLEIAAAFPVVFALFDWTRGGARRLRSHRRLHAGLWAVLALYLAARWLALSGQLVRGGVSYFEGVGTWVKLLTLATFWARYYLVPLATGFGSFLDAMKPFFPNASPSDPVAIFALAGWAALFAGAAWGVWKRRWWGFWIAFAGLFILPTTHLLFKYDTLGAERFLYLPSVGFFVILAVGSGRLAGSAAPALAAGVLAAFAMRTFATEGDRHDSMTYWMAVLSENPNSAAALDSIGANLAERGDLAQGEPYLKRSIAADPSRPDAYFNLARLCWDQKRTAEAEALLRRARELAPRDPSTLELSAVVAEGGGRMEEAEKLYRTALEIKPWDEVARFNLGRLLYARGDRAAAAEQWDAYLELAPDDSSARDIRALILDARRNSAGGRP